MRVLCIDSEGGHGGSSRSLFFFLKFVDRKDFSPTIVVRRGGSIQQQYEGLGISCQVLSKLPVVSAVYTIASDIRNYMVFMKDIVVGTPDLVRLFRLAKGVDVIHINNENMWFIALILRALTTKPVVVHIRTMGSPTPTSRLESWLIAKIASSLVFITENERDRFPRAGVRTPRAVVHNIAEHPRATEPHEAIAADGRFTIACLSNYTWERGLDRLIDIADILNQQSRHDILFAVAGDTALPGYLQGALGEIGRRGGSLVDYAEARGVSGMFVFLGHVSDPERVLAASDLLIKPTRESNPWGRDVIEALAAAKPVATVGSYAKFVEDGKTGVLMADFDASIMADRLCQLADDRAECAAMGNTGRARVAELCDGPARARDLAAIWTSAIGSETSK
jgi:glycosyltransferase involved in cell wall biosynthesis